MSWGVLLWGPYMRDPIILDACQVPLLVGNSHTLHTGTEVDR